MRDTINPVLTENAIAKEIVDAAFRIHNSLGPGLLESVYDVRLAGKRLGSLIDFHGVLIKDGVTRIVDGPEDKSLAKTPSPQRSEVPRNMVLSV